MRTVWTFHTAPGIYFGRGALGRLGEVVQTLGGERVFLVTDTVLDQLYRDRITTILADAGVVLTVFSGGQPEPSLSLAQTAAQEAKSAGAEVIVALGGGSNTDLAKSVALLLAHGGLPSSYAGEFKLPGPVMPLVAISTTAGTGSEVSGVAILTDEEARLKIGIADNHLRPRVAIYDPELTVSCPPRVTADAGLDALTHAVEAYTALDYTWLPVRDGERVLYQGKNPMGDLLAEEAIRLIARHLRSCYYQPRNLDAREAMHLASLLAGMSFSNAGVTATHALEYAVGPAAHISHGLGNALLLPYVLEFNLAARSALLAQVASFLGEDVGGLTERAAAEKAVGAIRRLCRDLGVPERLRDIGIQEADLPELARKAATSTRILRNQPRPTGEAELLAILRAAY